MRTHQDRDDAHGHLSVVLRLHALWRAVEAEAGRLLRLLFLRRRAMPARAGRGQGQRLLRIILTPVARTGCYVYSGERMILHLTLD